MKYKFWYWSLKMAMLFTTLSYAQTLIEKIGKVKFHDAFDTECNANKAPLSFCKTMYQAMLSTQLDTITSPKIPLHFHIINLTNSVFHRDLIYNISLFHPHAKVTVWTEEELRTFEFVNKPAYVYAETPQEKSYCARYEILNRFGGIFIDHSIRLLKPLHDLLNACLFFSCISEPHHFELSPDIIACVPAHPLIQQCLAIKPAGPKSDNQAIYNRSGSHFFTKSVLSRLQTSWQDVILFPKKFFLSSLPKPYSYATQAIRSPSPIQPTFHDSMGYVENVPLHYNHALLKKIYDKNGPSRFKAAKNVIIPQIIHQIWLGPAQPPLLFEHCRQTIKTLHPTWEYRLWRDADVVHLKLVQREIYESATNYGEKSDILRYELLNIFGGVYLDVDMEMLKSLDILHKHYTLYAGIMPLDTQSVITNAVLASTPGHPLMKTCLNELPFHRNNISVLQRTGPLFFQKVFLSFVKNIPEKIIALPASYFFPINLTESKYISYDKRSTKIKPESFTLHHWTGSWTLQSANLP